jgi:hypothetical protein
MKERIMDTFQTTGVPFCEQDLTGQERGLLTAVRRVSKDHWLFQCKCGGERIVSVYDWRRGATESCGCKYKGNQHYLKHGMSRSGEYICWRGMIARCTNENDPGYHNYGGRGIKICDRWLGGNGFANFFADMGKRPSPKHSIDRFPDKNGNYELSNCRWATSTEQNRNRRSNTHIMHNGETRLLTEWAESVGMKFDTLCKRLKRGWDIEKSLKVPVGKWRR